MKFATYKNINGGTSMISPDKALAAIRELGHTFAVALAERGYDTKESDLMSGLAAYHLLKLEGESPRLDAAHRSVVREITNAMADQRGAA